MDSGLYLDTARMGKISPRARAIQSEYLEFSAEFGCSLPVEILLLEGGESWDDSLRSRFPHLGSWAGVADLKSRLRTLAGASQDHEVLVASRTRVLMYLAAHLLTRKAEQILTVDLGWPAYQQILADLAARNNRTIVELPLRRSIQEGATADDIVQRVARFFREQRCQALFLPAISHDGIRLPIKDIIHQIRRETELRFTVVDGAQDLAHAPVNLQELGCDFYVAGTHKWLRGHYPLGVGFSARNSTSDYVQTTLSRLVAEGSIDDPLLCLTRQLECRELDGITETVNLSGLFSACGAITDALESGYGTHTLALQKCSVQQVTKCAKSQGWLPRSTDKSLSSGILMLSKPCTSLQPAALRQRFAEMNVAISAYERGTIRVAVPQCQMTTDELCLLDRALACCH